MTSGKAYLKRKMAGVEIEHLNITEAKRVEHHLYETLQSELCFEGCMTCAKYFEYLVCEENELMTDKFINQRMLVNKTELLKLYETCKAAELVSKLKTCLSRKSTYELIYQAWNIAKSLPDAFYWFTKSFLEIIIVIADSFGVNDVLCCEFRAKIYTHYAVFYMQRRAHDFQKEIKYFEKALSLSRAKDWRTDNITRVFDEKNLHEFVGVNFASVLFKSAMAFIHTDPRYGIEQADRSIKCIAEVGQLKLKILVVKAILVKARLLIEISNYKEAMKNLRTAERYVTGEKTSEFQKVRCEINICKGICYENLGNTSYAMAKLKLAVLLARHLELNKQLGLSLLQIAKIYMKTPNKYYLAENALREARDVFQEEKESENKICVKYMFALLQTEVNHKSFIDLIKQSEFNYCDLYKLRQWKYQAKPFWKRRGLITFIKSYTTMSLLSRITSDLPSDESEEVEEQTTEISESESEEMSSDPLDCLLNEYK
ncbi:uncharacterized protein LOC105210014 [Zeugodacus cucurbitae]|uniref:uncharacterized protein LOC105210014 n=1 Tax=Zeugodacus cucurbitae TaxID=28588 RepID=UPI0005969429|nr:uncharacterized protein LOC105210014 [Zeugodacus cucurbitae]